MRDPNAYRNQTLNLSGWIDGPISPDYDKGYLADGPDYFSRSTKLRIMIEGARAEWIESGTKVNVTATLIWDTVDARLLLQVHHIEIDADEPVPIVALAWTEGFDDWQWDINKRVSINGIVKEVNGTLVIEREGTQVGEQLCLLGIGSELQTQTAAGGTPIDWEGRLTTLEDVTDRSVKLCLDRR